MQKITLRITAVFLMIILAMTSFTLIGCTTKDVSAGGTPVTEESFLELRTDVDGLLEQITALRTALDTATGNITNAGTRIDDLEKDVTAAQINADFAQAMAAAPDTLPVTVTSTVTTAATLPGDGSTEGEFTVEFTSTFYDRDTGFLASFSLEGPGVITGYQIGDEEIEIVQSLTTLNDILLGLTQVGTSNTIPDVKIFVASTSAATPGSYLTLSIPLKPINPSKSVSSTEGEETELTMTLGAITQ